MTCILKNLEQENMSKDIIVGHWREISLKNTENNYWILMLKQEQMH